MSPRREVSSQAVKWSIVLVVLIGVMVGVGTWWARRARQSPAPIAENHATHQAEPVREHSRIAAAEVDDVARFFRLMNTAKAHLEIGELGFATREPSTYGMEDLEDLIEFGTSPRACIDATR